MTWMYPIRPSSSRWAASKTAVGIRDLFPRWSLISESLLTGTIWTKPFSSVLEESTRGVYITLAFSSMVNVGVVKTQSAHTTNRGDQQTAFLELVKETPISYMPSWRKVNVTNAQGDIIRRLPYSLLKHLSRENGRTWEQKCRKVLRPSTTMCAFSVCCI